MSLSAPPDSGGLMRYDRRVNTELLKVLAENGFAHSLVEYARHGGRWALDLQFRADPNSSKHKATLYSGLTIALELQYSTTKDRFKLDAPKPWQTRTKKFDLAWSTWQQAAELASVWFKVDAYLETVLPIIDKAGRFTRNEGAVQSALSNFYRTDFHVIDRESVIGFPDIATQQKAFRTLEKPVLDALELTNGKPWWTPPTRLGNECDTLAVTPQGQLLAIEIKPGTALRGITWAPAQVQHYADLFQAWIDEPTSGTASPRDILTGMVEQRVELGLLPASSRVTFPGRIEVIPVVAVGPGAKQTAWDRLHEVAQRVETIRRGSAKIELWEVNTIGRVQSATGTL
jgi:hypothetical protein